MNVLRALHLLASLSMLATAFSSGCYHRHERDEHNDASIEAAEPDAGPPPACTARCAAPILIAEATAMPLGAFRRAVLDVAAVQDTRAVLVVEPREPPVAYSEYALYLHSAGAEGLRRSSEGAGLTVFTIADGMLVARPNSFVAVLLVWREIEGAGGPWAGLHLAEWSTEGELLQSGDVHELVFLRDAECRAPSGVPCHAQASFRRGEDDTVLVTFVTGSELYRARIDLSSWSVTEIPPLPLPEGRRIGEPIAALESDAGTFFAAVGGPAPWSRARPSTLFAFNATGAIARHQEIPGLSYEPPAVLAPVDGRPTLWRYVTDASRPLESAVEGWRLTSDGISEVPDWKITTSIGFRPSFVEVLESEAHGEIVAWVSPDPRNAEHSTLSLLRLRPDFEECDGLTPATAAQFPWPLMDVDSRPLATMLDGESVVAAVLGDRSAGDIPLVLLRIPGCE